MASLPKSDPTPRPMTATELLAIRGTPQFEVEYRRQAEAIVAHQRKTQNRDANDFIDWDVPGWTYDAEL